MITDGKPTCIIRNGKYYKNSFGIDQIILNKTLNLAAYCRRMGIRITTFMIAKDPYLQKVCRRVYKGESGQSILYQFERIG